MTIALDSLSTRQRVLALGLLALVFAFGLFDHSLWSANDSREGAMIREMFREGVWVTPVFNGRHYLEKPPLLHWTGLVFCHALGTVNEGLVRLPAALYGFGAVLIIWLWSRQLGHEAAGLAAAFMCATAALYFEYTKIVLTDAALTFMVLLSLFLFWKTWASGRDRWFDYLPFLLVSAISFYAKGLIGPGFVWVTVTGFLFYRRQWRRWMILMLMFVPLAIAVVAPWLVALWKTGGREFLVTALWANQFGRFFVFNNPGLPLDPFFVHKEPLSFYLTHLPERLMPWTLLVLPALVYWFRRNGQSASAMPARPGCASGAPGSLLAVYLRVALVAMALVLHGSSAKAACYALPLFPILFLMTGIWLEDAAGRWGSAVERWLIGITMLGLGLAALVVPMVYIVLFLWHSDLVWIPCRLTVYLGLVLALLALVAGLALAPRLWRQFRNGQRTQVLLAVPVVTAVLLILNAGAFFPAYDYQRTYEPFVNLVRQEIQQGRRIALAGDRERDCGAFMFYLDSRLQIVPLSDGSECSRFLDEVPGPAGIIVSQRDLGTIARLLAGRPLRVMKCDDCGYKSAEFRLLVYDPPSPSERKDGGTSMFRPTKSPPEG
ncbi:MAG: glycosyltransferase family 39 protein [Verrucomicrobia bacterium]|nr:glycosyltransferase family 39 protein [Verrucomicrobiota bacterium]MBU4247095.1 glycosyltransferase family 39 protein [Verrucomicrobiota bacterium]MBU4290245.1 glycosyltransferase family 39 protein [Verrucomicrobiota bacterium]MBU4498220.1 glycosyltransferase family 39 protein [Verrucomicrobiota bacterium]MCG2679962.1 glycosyltransferase family 39 protein [Kiritimatiellia bacterium]